MCHRKIPNGQKFCENCKQKRKTKADESYLDSLLSSVGEIRPEPKNESKPDKQPFGDYPAYTDNNSISRGNKPVQKTEADAPAEMDDMLTDLLNDMDEAGEFEQQPENNIGEDDIENIFDEAEAYAELLSKDQNQEEQNENRNTAMFEHLDEQQTLSGEETDSGLSDQDFIDVNWNESSGDNDYIPEQEIDDGFNEEDEIILNEGYNNVEAAFSDFDPLNEEIEAEAKPKSKKDSWFKRLIPVSHHRLHIHEPTRQRSAERIDGFEPYARLPRHVLRYDQEVVHHRAGRRHLRHHGGCAEYSLQRSPGTRSYPYS